VPSSASIIVRLMCAPPEENLMPNASKAGEAAGKPSEEMLLVVNWTSSSSVMLLFV
jgi:hypothetical protein